MSNNATKRSVFRFGSSMQSDMDNSVSSTYGFAHLKESMNSSSQYHEEHNDDHSKGHTKDKQSTKQRFILERQRQQSTNNLQYAQFNRKNIPVEVTDADTGGLKLSLDSKNNKVLLKLEPHDGEVLRGSLLHQVYRYIAKPVGIYNYETHKFKLNEYLISLQNLEHKNQNYLFFYVVYGELEDLKQKLEGISDSDIRNYTDAAIRNCTDAVGANIIHVAYLLKKYDIGRYLVERFPDAALEGYANKSTCKHITPEQMPYTGENILQIAIVHKNHTEVRWLLDFYRDHKHSLPCGNEDSNRHGLKMLLDAKATGTFFTGKVGDKMANSGFFKHENSYYQNEHYFGETPLHFAACTNDIDLFDLVLTYVTSEYPDALFMRDSHGNNLLHIAVIRNLTKMFKHIKDKAEESLKLRTRDAYTRYLLQQGSIDVKEAPHSISPPDTAPGNQQDPIDAPDSTAKLPEAHFPFTISNDLDATTNNTTTSIDAYISYLRELGSIDANEAPHSTSPTDTAPENAANKQPEAQLNDSDTTTNSTTNSTEKSGYYHKISEIVVPPDGENKEAFISEQVPDKLAELLMHALNDDGHTPRTLAAEKGNKEMLEFMVREYTDHQWSYGPLSVSRINLDGLERPAERELYTTRVHKPLYSAIEWLCMRKHYDCIQIPLIQQIIKVKWTRVGLPILRSEALLSFLITTLMTLILVLGTNPPSIHNHNARQLFVTCLYGTSCGLFLNRYIREIPLVIEIMKFNYEYSAILGGLRGSPVIDKICVHISSFAFFVLCYAQASSPRSTELLMTISTSTLLGQELYYAQLVQYSLVVCVVFSWFHVYYYLMVLESTGPFILILYKVISSDVPYFLGFYLIILLALGCAISLMTSTTNTTQSMPKDFFHLVQVWWTLLKVIVQFPDDFHTENILSGLDWFYDFIRTSYSVTSIILMLNLLVAMMTSTYQTYSKNSDELLLVEKYNIMCTMLRVQSKKSIISQCSNYAFEVPKNKFFENEIIITQVRKWFYKIEDYDRAWFQDSSTPMTPITTTPMAPITTTGTSDVDTSSISNTLSNQSNHLSKNTHLHDNILTTITNPRTILMILDPQNDFGPNGALHVKGSKEDAVRIAAMITENYMNIHEIYVTLDTHHSVHIGNASFWWDSITNEHPIPMTELLHDDIINGKWIPRLIKYTKYVKQYAKRLKERQLPIFVWPNHCIIGTKGHSVMPDINAALQLWTEKTHKSVHYIRKGENEMTEMYSALSAAALVFSDKTTLIDMNLIGQLQIADKILVCGEALTHTVKYTLLDLCQYIDARKIYILEDGTSPVQMPNYNYENVVYELKKDMKNRGANFTTTIHAFPTVQDTAIITTSSVFEREGSIKNIVTNASREMDTDAILRKISELSEQVSSQIYHKSTVDASEFNPNLASAYTILTDPASAPDFVALREYLREIGVSNPSDLEYCSKDHVNAIKSKLKDVKGRAFIAKLGVAVKESSDQTML